MIIAGEGHESTASRRMSIYLSTCKSSIKSEGSQETISTLLINISPQTSGNSTLDSYLAPECTLLWNNFETGENQTSSEAVIDLCP